MKGAPLGARSTVHRTGPGALRPGRVPSSVREERPEPNNRVLEGDSRWPGARTATLAVRIGRVAINAIRCCASSDGSLTCWLAALVDGRGVTATCLHRKYAAIGREIGGVLRRAIRSISRRQRNRSVPYLMPHLFSRAAAGALEELCERATRAQAPDKRLPSPLTSLL